MHMVQALVGPGTKRFYLYPFLFRITLSVLGPQDQWLNPEEYGPGTAPGSQIWVFKSRETVNNHGIAILTVQIFNVLYCWGSFYCHGLTLIPAWISNHMPNEAWDAFAYPFQNLNGCAIEIWQWISDFSPHFIMDIIINPWLD